jgi:hypothetical protein
MSRPIHFLENNVISFFFNGWITPHCTYVPHFLYPFLRFMDSWVDFVSWLLWIMLLFSQLAVLIYIHRKCSRISFFHIISNTFTICFFDNSPPNSIRWYLILLLLCIFLMITDADRFSYTFWSIFLSSFWKISFQVFCYF